MKKNLLRMLTAFRPLALTMAFFSVMALASCSDSNDNKDNPAPEPTPTEELPDYTLFIYGHSGGHMDEIIVGDRPHEAAHRGLLRGEIAVPALQPG